VFVVALTVFVLGHLLPGDPITFIIGESQSAFSPEQIAAIRHDYGLDQPMYVQFAIWLSKAVTGDFGRSFQSHQQVLDVIIPRMLPTAQIAIETWIPPVIGTYGWNSTTWRPRAIVSSLASSSVKIFRSVPSISPGRCRLKTINDCKRNCAVPTACIPMPFCWLVSRESGLENASTCQSIVCDTSRPNNGHCTFPSASFTLNAWCPSTLKGCGC